MKIHFTAERFGNVDNQWRSNKHRTSRTSLGGRRIGRVTRLAIPSVRYGLTTRKQNTYRKIKIGMG